MPSIARTRRHVGKNEKKDAGLHESKIMPEVTPKYRLENKLINTVIYSLPWRALALTSSIPGNPLSCPKLQQVVTLPPQQYY
jgi:hypothetical protein